MITPNRKKMTDIPWDRITPNHPTFMFVGIDGWGPWLVREGYKEKRVGKRWAILFTCLVTCACHIEQVLLKECDFFFDGIQQISESLAYIFRGSLIKQGQHPDYINSAKYCQNRRSLNFPSAGTYRYRWHEWVKLATSAGTSPTVWTRGLASLGLAGTRGLASPIADLLSFKTSPKLSRSDQ